MKVGVEIELPRLPNFIRLTGTKEGDVCACVDVADVDDEDLGSLGDAWAEALIAHARRRRADRQMAKDGV